MTIIAKILTTKENNELISKVKHLVNIIDYASYMGLHLVKKSEKYYSLKEYDSVIIDNRKNCFWRNSDSSSNATGSVIDFTMYFKQITFHEAMNLLISYLGGVEAIITYSVPFACQQEEENQKSNDLQLPKKSITKKNVYAYLLKTRCINTIVVQEFFDKKMLYQDIKNNCVFVSYNIEGKPVFSCLRGTITNIKFVSDIKGSDYNKCFYINNCSDQVIVTESVIDAMSIMSLLFQKKKNYHDYDYLALSGSTKYDAIYHTLTEYNRHKKIITALDNDESGLKSTDLIVQSLIDKEKEYEIQICIPYYKDWNMDLQNGKEISI